MGVLGVWLGDAPLGCGAWAAARMRRNQGADDWEPGRVRDRSSLQRLQQPPA